MSKVLYSVTMSLDGFIAGPGGDMSWLTEYLGPDPAVKELMQSIGALPSRRQGRRIRWQLDRATVRAHPPPSRLAPAGHHLRR